jgi:hypothetical protein
MSRAEAPWRVKGSYFECCNCDAICPCRRVGGRPGGSSTYGECFGALSWIVAEGHFGDVDLSGRMVVLTVRYFDRDDPPTLWEVVVYVDDQADDEQLDALGRIFSGRAGGTVSANYGTAIGEVRSVRRAKIELDHAADRRRLHVRDLVHAEAADAASNPGEVACGIPGFDRPGTELYGEGLVSNDPVLRFEVQGRRSAAFATDFDYRS